MLTRALLLSIIALIATACDMSSHVKLAECTDPHRPTHAVEVFAGNEDQAKDLHVKCSEVVRDG